MRPSQSKKENGLTKIKSDETYKCDVFDVAEMKHVAKIGFKDGEFCSATGFPFASQFSLEKAIVYSQVYDAIKAIERIA